MTTEQIPKKLVSGLDIWNFNINICIITRHPTLDYQFNVYCICTIAGINMLKLTQPSSVNTTVTPTTYYSIRTYSISVISGHKCSLIGFSFWFHHIKLQIPKLSANNVNTRYTQACLCLLLNHFEAHAMLPFSRVLCSFAHCALSHNKSSNTVSHAEEKWKSGCSKSAWRRIKSFRNWHKWV